MKISEILLNENVDRIKSKLYSYTNQLTSTSLTNESANLLKNKIKRQILLLKEALAHSVSTQHTRNLSEAINKIPITDDDFKVVIELMQKPIPAAVAIIYFDSIIDDDELNDTFVSLQDTQPNRDVRTVVADWFKRVMPDQMHRLEIDKPEFINKQGDKSVLPGIDPVGFRTTNNPMPVDIVGRA